MEFDHRDHALRYIWHRRLVGEGDEGILIDNAFAALPTRTFIASDGEEREVTLSAERADNEGEDPYWQFFLEVFGGRLRQVFSDPLFIGQLVIYAREVLVGKQIAGSSDWYDATTRDISLREVHVFEKINQGTLEVVPTPVSPQQETVVRRLAIEDATL